MKILLILIISFLSFSNTIHHWVDHHNKSLFYVPKLELKVSLVRLGEDKNDWGTLIIDSGYSMEGVDSDQSLKDLKSKYSSYEIRPLKASLNKENLSISILPIDKVMHLTPRNSVHGIYFYTQLDLNYHEYQKIHEFILENEIIIKIYDEVDVDVSLNQIVEEVKVSGSVCSRIFKDGSTTYSVIKNLIHEERKIESKKFKFQNTKKDLLTKLKYQCVQQDISDQILNFKDLLSSKLYQNNSSKDLIGQTIKLKKMTKSVGLQTRITSFKELK